MRLSQDMVWEILVQLPTRSLMRFKLVSQLWYSIIRNPRFAKEHSRLSGPYRGLVVTNFDYTRLYLYDLDTPKTIFYVYAAGDPIRRMIDPYLSLDLSNFSETTRFVKGLVGYGTENTFGLCNVATHERVNLPPAPVGEEYNYHLGYDPVDEIYKVLIVYRTFDDEDIFAGCGNSQIFSIGDGANPGWRSIAPAPVYSERQSLCVNGTLYWLQPLWSAPHPGIIAFHLNTETFEIIRIPESESRHGNIDLVEIGGNLAFISYKEGYYVGSNDHPIQMISVYSMHNDGAGGPARWDEQNVEMRMRWRYSDVPPYHVADLLLMTYVGTFRNRRMAWKMLLAPSLFEEFPIPIYVYDHITNRTACFTLDGIVPSEHELNEDETFQICYHEENLIPLSHFVN